MGEKEYKKLQSSVKKKIDKLVFETEEKIHRAIKEDDAAFLNWFFFSCSDKDQFMKLLNNSNFSNKEKAYIESFLVEMGKI